MQETKKVLSLLLCVTLVFSCMTAIYAQNSYSDTQGHWAESAINRWSDYGIVEGDGNGFHPDSSLTRGQMAKILAKTLGITKTAENPFSDIRENDWYTPYILNCYAANIMLGDNGQAKPDNELTRQEAMVMLARALNIAPADADSVAEYSDAADISDWALPYVSALISKGIVNGVEKDVIAPFNNMTRASLLAVLDRSISQYINKSGSYTLNNDGIILVASGDVTLSGTTSADIIITDAASNKNIAFNNATINGCITVMSDNTKITTQSSVLPEIAMLGNGTTVDKKTVAKKSSGGSGGSSSRLPSNLTIDNSQLVSEGTYNNVTISDSVEDGEVTLSKLTIKGNLTINGGGSNSIKLNECIVEGKIIISKPSGQVPRLELTKTPVASIETKTPSIIEATDTQSAISDIKASANLEIKGENTAISNVTVEEGISEEISVAVNAGSIDKLNAKSSTSLTGSKGEVKSVIAEAAITADSTVVEKIEIPQTAAESISVEITGEDSVEIEINSNNGAQINTESADISLSTKLDEIPADITFKGEEVTHLHTWNDGVESLAPTCTEDGTILYTCIAQGCGDVAATITKPVSKLGHKWGEWHYSDDELHVRECANNPQEHYEKNGHGWDEGKITQNPSLQAPGIKVYTCSVCKGTKQEEINCEFMFTDSYNNLAINWTAATLAEGEQYYAYTNYKDTYFSTTYNLLPIGSTLVNRALPSDKLTLKVAKGTSSESSQIIYQETEIATVTLSGKAPAVSLKKNAENKFYFDSAITNGIWIYQVFDQNSRSRKVANAFDGTIDITLEDGYSVVAQHMTWELLNNNTYANINITESVTLTYTVPATTSLILEQSGNDYRAKWSGFDANSYRYELVDANGTSVYSANTTDSYSMDFALISPRPQSGTNTYSFVLYSDNTQLGRIDNCLEITVSGNAFEYDIAFNNPKNNEHTVTMKSQLPTGGKWLDCWILNDKISTRYSTNVTKYDTERVLSKYISEGESYDLRHLSSYTLNNNVVKMTMTPPSTKTYALSSPFTYTDTDYLKLNFDAVELASGDSYVIKSSIEYDYHVLDYNYFPVSLSLANAQATEGKYSIEVGTGTDDMNYSQVYPLTEVANINISGTTPSYTIEKTDDGKYKIVCSENVTGSWLYDIYNEKGVNQGWGQATNGVFSHPSVTSGCTIKCRLMTWTLNDAKTYANINLTQQGSATYTETTSSDNNIHLEMNGNILSLVFEDEEGLSDGEWYYLFENGQQMTSDNLTDIEITWLIAGRTQSNILSYEIRKGVYSDSEVFATLENALDVKVTNTIPDAELVAQADGTYKIVSGNNNTGYFYAVSNPDGTRLATDYTADGTFLCAIYEGCTVEIQEAAITIAQDALSADIVMSSPKEITTPPLHTGLNSVVEVSTAQELVDAVNKGAIATLTDDITANETLKLKTGAPASIDLNGHTLTVPNLRVYYGKELTIDGTDEGSSIVGKVTTQMYAKLTLNGGTYYGQIVGNSAREFNTRNIRVECEESGNAAYMWGCDNVWLDNSTFISTSPADYSMGLYVNQCDRVTLENVTASAESNWFGADIAWCEIVGISGGEYHSVNSSGLRFLDSVGAIKGATFSSENATALLVQDGSQVEISDGEFTSGSSNIIQLSGSNSKLTILGGNYSTTNENDNKYIATINSDSVLDIQGGTFTGVTDVCSSHKDVPTVTGGTFSFDVTDYVDTAAYTVTPNGAGTQYTVTEK